MLKKIYLGFIALLAFVQTQAQSPTTSPDSSYKRCGVTKTLLEAMAVPPVPYSRFSLLIPPASYPPGAIEVCGPFTVYYEDIRLGLTQGYNEPVSGLGVMRRNNLCQVLQYIDSVFDFSLVPPGGIKILVDRSDTYFGAGSAGLPFYFVPPVTHPIVDGYVAEYTRTGTDPAPGDFHGMIGIDFKPIMVGYFISTPTNSDYSVTAACGIDLAAMELHHLSHVLGMFSFVEETSGGVYTTIPALSGPFTRLDTAVHTTSNPATTSNPFGSTSLSPFISSSFAFTPSASATDRLFWVNGKQPPYNHGMDKANYTPAVWHYNDIGTSYRYQSRISPGDDQEYVSINYEVYANSPMRRRFTKGELETFTSTLGYAYNPIYATAHATEIANRIPWCSKMGSDIYNQDFIKNEGPEIIPADFTLVNNIGSSIVIGLTTDTTLKDADGDPITIYPGSLVNFRGCGEGGNNHDLLTVNGAGNEITYTPREDFYGRAQFGFNLYDGVEKGGFVLYTIDVRKGSNVSIPAGENIILNGSFEEGSEVKIIGTLSSESINNAMAMSSVHTARLPQQFGDSHPYDILKGPIGNVVINNSADNGMCLTTTKATFGAANGTFPAPWTVPWVSAFMPNPPFIAEKRYKAMGNPGLLMYLGENMQQCRRYALEFYARRTYTAGFPYPSKEAIRFGFTDDAHMQGSAFAGEIENVDLTYSPTSSTPAEHAFTTGEWQKVKISFTFCDTTAANILYLDVHDWKGPLVDPGMAPPGLILDSVSLKEVDFDVDIAISYPGGCSRTLVANADEIASYGCNSVLYTWTDLSGTVLGTGKELTVSAMTLKSYIVTADDGCGHTAADTIDVAPCRCAPGEVMGTSSFTTLSGTVPSTLSPGLYYAASDLTVSGTTTFNNAILLMEPDVAINVSNTAKLILDTTHIFTCPDTNRLWAGIRLQSAGSNSARIEVKNGSLIEDADTAIKALNIKAPPSGNIIDITNSTFNRNWIGLSVKDGYTLPTGDSSYPIRVERTLFTSRDFDTMAGYPFSWAPTERLRDELAIVTDTKAPYLINKDYTKAYLKNDTMAYLGMEFINMGHTVVPGTVYYEVKIGEPNFPWNRNIIDNMQFGFRSNNSNATLVNTHIINIGKRMVPDDDTNHSYPTSFGWGIFGLTTDARKNRVRIGAGANAKVKLYDCYTGVVMEDVADVDIKAVAISSSHTLGDKPVPGTDKSSDWYSGEGIKLIGNKNQIRWNISQDTISNMNAGIYLWLGNPDAGALTTIENNQLFDQNTLPKFSGLTGLQYMLQGITVAGPGISNVNTVSIKLNMLTGVFNGIQLNHLQSATATITDNTINISDKTIATPGTPQYGINTLACIDATITANSVSTTTLGALAYAKNIKGFYASNNTNLRLCGNFTNRIGSAFVFDGRTAQVGTRWIGNTINDGWQGMTLASDIGDQGFMYDWRTVPTSTFYGAALNKWTGYGGTKFQTIAVDPINTMLSKLYVKDLPSGTVERPTINESAPPGLPFPSIYRYTGGSESIRVPNGASDANCHGAIYPQQVDPRPEVSASFRIIGSLGRLVIDDSLGYDSTYQVNQWCNQLAVYELATIHPELRDSSGTLDTFMIHAAGSRFGWLTAIDEAIGTGDITTAQSLLNTPVPAMCRVVVNCDVTITDYTAANSIVSDYLAYYNTYIRMLQDTITPIDTATIGAIARKCPPVDGAVVYKARALYQLLTGLTVQYKDDSCAYGLGGHSLFRVAPEEALTGNSDQDYTLFPNPNAGVFSIRQAIPSDKLVEAKIYNALGQELHRETVQFRGGVITFRLDNAMPGLYLVCITDEQHKVVCLKFNIR